MSVIIRRMSSWSGRTVGNVVIGNLIARGGMAEVYLGRHATLERDVAVKIMRDHVDEDPESRRRFEREAQVIASLSHPNIIQIHDYNLPDGRPCLVMELVSGASLGGYLKALQTRGEKLPLEIVKKLLASIASAVDHAHSQNIVHRDIKPANILLRSKSADVDESQPLPLDVEPVLTDFGLVRLLDSSTQTSTGAVFGTPSYMSPEQARGDRVNHKTDIYSLGVVLYEMLAGAVPFDAESTFGVLMKHLNEPPPPIAGLSPALQAVINRALAKDPAQRFESAGEFAEEFIAASEGGKISERTEKVGELVARPLPPPQSNAPSRLPFIVGGLLALAIVAFFGIWMLLRPPVLQPRIEKDQIVGKATFFDFNNPMDKTVVTVSELPLPAQGTHYEAWFLSQGGEKRLNLGVIQFEGLSGSLTYVNPQGSNLLGLYDQVEITLEPNDDPNPNESSGDVVASSIFPPLALNHARHVLVAIGSAPEGIALIQGLWIAADNIVISVEELDTAFDEGDEETLRQAAEEVINGLVGSGNADLYKDWNGDGEVGDATDGFGLLQNGDSAQRGYLTQTLSHAQFAAAAPDATKNIIEATQSLAACVASMEERGNQLLDLALKLREMKFDSGMEATIADMLLVSSRLLYGEDANSNGRIETLAGECGADIAYEAAYLMAEMPLLPGADRIPPPAP